jgi:hypothetical protein
MIEVGSLLKLTDNGTAWLVLDEIADTVLVISQKTNHKMWAIKEAFEVIG